jgi:hypothetical protein
MGAIAFACGWSLLLGVLRFHATPSSPRLCQGCSRRGTNGYDHIRRYETSVRAFK